MPEAVAVSTHFSGLTQSPPVASSVLMNEPPATQVLPLPETHPADAESLLVGEALAGDGAAFARLVRPHLPMLHRVAARAARDPLLAEDAVQETLEIAYRRLRTYRPGTSLRAFLAGIAARRGRTLVRSEVRRRLREDASGTGAAPPDAEAEARASEDARRVASALAAMPEKRRRAAILRLDAGLSHAQIAEALGSTEGSARVLVHLALRELRELLEPPCGRTT